MAKDNQETGAVNFGGLRYLAALVVDSEGHARRCQQEQRLLL